MEIRLNDSKRANNKEVNTVLHTATILPVNPYNHQRINIGKFNTNSFNACSSNSSNPLLITKTSPPPPDPPPSHPHPGSHQSYCSPWRSSAVLHRHRACSGPSARRGGSDCRRRRPVATSAAGFSTIQCCWWPMILPGRQMRSQAIVSGAVSR